MSRVSENRSQEPGAKSRKEELFSLFYWIFDSGF
jgi:hypothetical protein